MPTRLSAGVVIVLLAAGCASIPRPQLAQYKTAFAQLTTISEEMLLDFDRAQKESREYVERERQAAQHAAPPSLDPPFSPTLDRLIAATTSPPDAIEVRRRALVTVARYNEVLTALAEGKSLDEVRTTAATLVDAANKLLEVAGGSGIPAVGSVTKIVSLVAAELEKQRLNVQFAKAIREGAPIIVEILAVFRADRGDHYAARARLADATRVVILNETRRNLRAVLAELGARTGTAAALQPIQAALDKSLLPMRDQLEEYPVKLAFAAAGTAYDPGAERIVRDRLTRVEELGGRYAENTARMKAFGEATLLYIRLLEGTQRAMEAIVVALDAPVDLKKVVDDLLPIAFAVRRELEVAQTTRSAR